MTVIKAYQCDDCSFVEEDAKGLKFGKSLPYGEIYTTGEPQDIVIGKWRIIGRVHPDDSAAIKVEHYCPNCEADHAL